MSATTWSIVLGAVVFAVGAGSCTPSEERQVRAVLTEHLEAWRFGDVEGALATHVDASVRGTYCTSEAFMTVLLDVQRLAPEPGGEVCDAAVRATQAERASDETVLLAQVTRHVCETPAGGCVGYQRRVAAGQIASSTRWEDAHESFEVRAVRVSGDEASARVEHEFGDGRVRRGTMRLVRVLGTWHVVDRVWLEDDA
ncbi:MAG: hypothetical protein AAGI01_08230 [Myxococcota bacterium]